MASILLKSTGALDRLAKESGVYNASSTGKTPGFIVDPSFPQRLPHNWMIGQVGASMSTSMTTSGSTTGRVRWPTTRQALKDPRPEPLTTRANPSTALVTPASMAPSRIAAKRLLRFWNSTSMASCCARGAVPQQVQLHAKVLGERYANLLFTPLDRRIALLCYTRARDLLLNIRPTLRSRTSWIRLSTLTPTSSGSQCLRH